MNAHDVLVLRAIAENLLDDWAQLDAGGPRGGQDGATILPSLVPAGRDLLTWLDNLPHIEATVTVRAWGGETVQTFPGPGGCPGDHACECYVTEHRAAVLNHLVAMLQPPKERPDP